MPPVVKEVHPLTTKHILGELIRRGKVAVDDRGGAIPIVKKLNRYGEGTQVFTVDKQPLTHIVSESSWLTGLGFETLVYPQAIAALMEEVTTAVEPDVRAEIEGSLRLMGGLSPWS